MKSLILTDKKHYDIKSLLTQYNSSILSLECFKSFVNFMLLFVIKLAELVVILIPGSLVMITYRVSLGQYYKQIQLFV